MTNATPAQFGVRLERRKQGGTDWLVSWRDARSGHHPEGVAVVHLFCTRSPGTDDEAVIAAVKAAQADDVQVVTVAVLGHKAELCFMALHPDSWKLRDLQTGLANAGLVVVDSFVSITEVSEYAQGVPEEMKNMRLYPELPPEGKSAWCFYPMTKRREAEHNWYRLEYDDRKELMYEHGASGRQFAAGSCSSSLPVRASMIGNGASRSSV